MFTNNPYAQGGWYNPENPQSINAGVSISGSPHPPTYGVLPSINFPSPTNLAFQLSSTDVLNCTVTGPGSKICFTIATFQASTIISRENGDYLARIEWYPKPWVEIVNIVPRQYISQWLAVSSDMSYRTMSINGRVYHWTPQCGAIILHTGGPGPTEQLGRITRTSRRVVVDLTASAINAGLFEIAIVATIILQSGRSLS